jgi:hypothetical protein
MKPFEVFRTQSASHDQNRNHVYFRQSGQNHAVTDAEELVRNAQFLVEVGHQQNLRQTSQRTKYSTPHKNCLERQVTEILIVYYYPKNVSSLINSFYNEWISFN